MREKTRNREIPGKGRTESGSGADDIALEYELSSDEVSSDPRPQFRGGHKPPAPGYDEAVKSGPPLDPEQVSHSRTANAARPQTRVPPGIYSDEEAENLGYGGSAAKPAVSKDDDFSNRTGSLTGEQGNKGGGS
ncbi:MAG TPA: hypothetical protein VGK99_18795 [Acidobacteriota bacterium]